MIKSMVLALSLALSFSANASTLNKLVADVNSAIFHSSEERGVFDWKVGDQATYNLQMGGFIKGSMVMAVKSVTADTLVLTQDLDLGFMGKQACEITLNPNTGETKSFVCNGQAQDPNAGGDIELIEQKEDTVKVPAGTFVCVYIKAKQGQNIIQQWVNPKQVPVMGLVKTLAPSQMGEVNVELVSFKKM
jgi:hypothetical protein